MLHLEWFDTLDLRTLHVVAALLGVFLALFVMQLWGTGEFHSEHEQRWLVHMRRAALMGLALAFLWSLSYADTKNWQPWPTDIAAVLAIDIFLLTNVISSVFKRWTRTPKTLGASQ